MAIAYTTGADTCPRYRQGYCCLGHGTVSNQARRDVVVLARTWSRALDESSRVCFHILLARRVSDTLTKGVANHGGTLYTCAMAKTGESGRRELRKHHPLIRLMRRIRNKHRIALTDVEACMEIPFQTLKQIEEGIRPLPGILGDQGRALGPWMQRWMACVQATAKERDKVERLLVSLILAELEGQLSDDSLDDGDDS
jgi:hypothetical protein